MNRAIKWVLIVVGVLIVLILSALLVIPLFVDIQNYKPQIEKRVSEATGLLFTLGGDLRLSLFPWAGLSLSDLHLGNLSGFEEKDFVAVKSFEVRVKLLPLLFKDIQVKRFVLEGPRIVLERNKDGRGNWEGIGKPSGEIPSKAPKEKRKAPESEPREDFPIKSLALGEFAITDGYILWIDQIKGERREISNVTLRLEDVSLDRPIHLALSARLVGHPLSLDGKVGPVGKELGKETIPLVFAVKALKQLDMSLKGILVDPAISPKFDLGLEVSPFSPRKLVTSLGESFPVATADPEALNLVALKAKLKGDFEKVSLLDGALDLDESRLSFSVSAKDFAEPNVSFDLRMDEIDLDRYLPPPSEKQPTEEEKKATAPPPGQKKIDYTPLRRLSLNGTVRVGKLKAQRARIQDLELKVSGKNSRFRLDPITLKLYEGSILAKAALDVRQDTPTSNVELDAEAIQVGPLLQDILKKDFLEGDIKAKVALRMAGDDAERIKKTLNGKGDFLFRDGAIKGVDLAGMVRNVKTAFGLEKKGRDRPGTDFSELHCPFTITNGVVNTPKTTLMSPLLRVMAAGEANLVKETLNFRVEPKFVATLKGQQDTMQRSGLMVPVLVSGTFASPRFRPDLKGILKKGLKERILKPSELKKILQGQGTQKDESKALEEEVKGILKGLPFGQ